MNLPRNLKLGVIDVLNVLPVYYGIISKRVAVPSELIFGRVTELNQKLNRGDLDISVISSFEYARNSELYYILPDLSVSADGAVRSIYLFLNCPLDEIDGKRIQLTEFSLSSVHLIQTILEEREVTYSIGDKDESDGLLLIADEAINRFYQKKDPHVYDLGELWKQKTGLPFAFALWVVRKDVFDKNKELIHQIYQALLESKAVSKNLFEEMANNRYQNIFPNAEICEEYLKNLHYDFSAPYQSGFNLFQEKMLQLNKLNKIAPLNFLPDL